MSETDAILAASTVRANAKTDQISGIPPRPLGVFRIGDVIDEGGHRIKFRFTTLDTKSSGYTICYVGRVKILKKTGVNNPSANPNDGTVVLDAIRHRDYGFEQYKDVQYDDTDVIEGQTYTYTAYVYSDHNICNIQEPSIQSIEIKANPDPFADIEVWGFYQDFTNLAPNSQITSSWSSDEYGVINSGYESAMTNIHSLIDYNKEQITLGNWKYFLDHVLQNYLFRIDPGTGTALSKVKDDPTGYHECEDGTDLTAGSYVLAPWISTLYKKEVLEFDASSSGQTYPSGRSVYFISPRTYDVLKDSEKTEWVPVGFLNKSDLLLKGLFLPGAYIDSNSKIFNTGSNATIPIKSKTMSELLTIISNIGSKFTFFGYPVAGILRDLEYMIFGTSNIQKAATYGNCGAGNLNSMRSNRVDSGYLSMDSSTFLRGFGTAWTKNTAVTQKKGTGFMFHSMVLGTYNQYVMDPSLMFSSYGYGVYIDNYKINLSGTGYTGTFYENDGYSDNLHYPLRFFKVSDQYGFVSYTNVDGGSTTTGLCDGTRRGNGGAGGALWPNALLGSCDRDEEGGPACMSFAPKTKADMYGAATILLPDTSYSPVE